MAWRSVESLKKLRAQIIEKWPNVDKTQFGTIGDAAHQAGTSDHNPEGDGTVDALDIPHQPSIGLDAHKVADNLLRSHDRRIKYIISNSRIGGDEAYAKRNNTKAWTWGPYTGSNPHNQHIHVSVNDAYQDDPAAWKIDAGDVTVGWKSGKGSWYSQYKGKYDWVDKGDQPNSNALGVPDYAQGIALYNQATLGKWFEVQYPNNKVSIEQQTDIGPAPGTGRTIDISAVAAERAGYRPHYVAGPNQFPTDEIIYYREIPAPAEVASLDKKAQALAYYKLRGTIPDEEPDEPPVDEADSIDEAFTKYRAAQKEWTDWLEEEVKKLAAAQPIPEPQPQQVDEFSELLEEIKPTLMRNLDKLWPIFTQLPASTQAKIFRLGISSVFSFGSLPAPQQEYRAYEEPEEITQPKETKLMTNEQIMSAVRWAVTMFGGIIAGWAAKSGFLTYDSVMGILTSETFIGIVVSIIALFFGQRARTQQAMISTVAAMPEVKEIVATKAVAEAAPSSKVTDHPKV